MKSLSWVTLSHLQLCIMNGVTQLTDEQLAISVIPTKIVIMLSSFNTLYIS